VNVLVVDDDNHRPRLDRPRAARERLRGDAGRRRQEALDRMARGPFDAVILDVLMPEVDGLAVCRSLRGVGNSVPILMLTRATRCRTA